MSDRRTGTADDSSADPGHPGDSATGEHATGEQLPEKLDEAESMRLISPGGLGRLAYSGRFGLTVLPVNYVLHEGSIVFRTAQDSTTDEDLRTGIRGAEYQVAFQIDAIDLAAREGWSVLIRGAAHHVNSDTERASVLEAGVEPWVGGARDLFMRITPARITGRRIRRAR